MLRSLGRFDEVLSPDIQKEFRGVGKLFAFAVARAFLYTACVAHRRKSSVRAGRERRGSRSGRGKSVAKRSIRRTRGAVSPLAFEVKSVVARDISAVVYFLFAAVTVLSIQGAFGTPGELWVKILQPILGWGIYIIPVMFGIISMMLFFSKTIQFGVARITGVVAMMVSILSILHLSVDANDLYAAASQGQYGGYTGFVTNFIFREVLHIGHIGSSIVFIAMLLIGLMLAFELTLGQIADFVGRAVAIRRVKIRGEGEDEGDEEGDEDDDDVDEEEDDAMDPPRIHKPLHEDSELQDLVRRVAALGKGDRDEVKTLSVEMDEHQGERDVVLQEVLPDGDAKASEDDSDGDDISATVSDDGPSADGSGEGGEEEAEEIEFHWEFPSLDLLSPAAKSGRVDEVVLRENADRIRNKLKQFDIEVQMAEINVGPTVVQYTLRPHEGVRLSKISNLKNDIALALAAKAIRIEAPIPGKSLVGIEVPNEKRTMVHLREVVESKEFSEMDSNLRLPIGRDVAGKPIVGDLTTMPHLLMAGSTGSGKSVGMNSFLLSLIYQNSPEDLRLIMVDPKRVELDLYNGIPHLLTPVITEPEKAAIALRWAVSEMTRRYKILSKARQRNVLDYMASLKPDDTAERLPNIVIVIDELADLMMTAKNEVEASVCRIAQMARAVGIHLIIATQRPSVDVITGLIKANIPSRISFAVSSQIDSRTVLDGPGAEDLLGRGDMLYLPGGMSKPLRVQGIYVSTAEVERVTNHAKAMMPPQYQEEVTSRKVADETLVGVPDSKFATPDEDMDDDAMVQEALKLVIESRKASASLLQRRLKVGYARAARLLDIMEEKGYIGPSQGAKPREIYVESALGEEVL